MAVTLDLTDVIDLRDPPAPLTDPVAPRPFDTADEDSAGLLVAGLVSAAVWLLVAVTVWRRLARQRTAP